MEHGSSLNAEMYLSFWTIREEFGTMKVVIMECLEDDTK